MNTLLHILSPFGLALTVSLMTLTSLPAFAGGPILWDDTWRTNSAAIIEAAERCIAEPDVAVTDKAQTVSGNRHNFEALSIYFWPDTLNPDGPWVVRDGVANPDYRQYDLPRLERLVRRLGFFAKAYSLTGDRRFYNAFCQQIDTWFIRKNTRMNPHFEYNQFAPGHRGGRGFPAGLIDAYNFVEVLEAIRLVDDVSGIGRHRRRAVKGWFRRFAEWMMTSEQGQQESQATNNHGTAYDVTLFAICHYIGRLEVCDDITRNYAQRRILPQIEADGRQPLELRRTKAFSYSIYNLQHMVDFCIMQRHLGQDFLAGEGKRIQTAIDYLLQFVGHRANFPYEEIGDWEGQERALMRITERLNH